jgi:hypothetical protein
LLGQNEALELLQQTLDQEKRTDEQLTELAMSQINLDAAEEGSEGTSEKTAARKRSTAARAPAKR